MPGELLWSTVLMLQERQKMKQRLEASVNGEDSLQQQVDAQQRQVDDANKHCEALQKARQEAEEELQVPQLPCRVAPIAQPAV